MTGIASTIQPSGFKLAADLSLPSDIVNSEYFRKVTFDPSGALTEALGLAGKFAVFGLTLEGMPTAELVTVKLTVDGLVVWNDVDFTPTNAIIALYGRADAVLPVPFTPFIVDNSMSLEVKTAADTSVTLNYIARPIL